MSTDIPSHPQIWELLPWVINGTATPGQRQLVDAHLPHCSDCRDELALQRLVHDGMNREAASGNPQAVLQRLLQRIDAPANPGGFDLHDGIDDEGSLVPSVPLPRRRLWPVGIAALLLLQSAAITLMAYELHQRPDSPGADAYQTLSHADASSPAATIRFVPAPELSVEELQKLLDDAGLRIVDSRSGSAIYGLAPTSHATEIHPDPSVAAIARLRGKPGVLLVEPIAATP